MTTSLDVCCLLNQNKTRYTFIVIFVRGKFSYEHYRIWYAQGTWMKLHYRKDIHRQYVKSLTLSLINIF